ncbi:hypothetical protein NPIL_72471 [Nephila pilipes]|uniref:Uncharacterized protein n=1 Tax=Nephila pilipes TaxID=299642 RepID=A0A8X6Q6B6_NEPPI|nr:hypothetical protein NPIL_72471 [Nephila pilipes]
MKRRMKWEINREKITKFQSNHLNGGQFEISEKTKRGATGADRRSVLRIKRSEMQNKQQSNKTRTNPEGKSRKSEGERETNSRRREWITRYKLQVEGMDNKVQSPGGGYGKQGKLVRAIGRNKRNESQNKMSWKRS